MGWADPQARKDYNRRYYLKRKKQQKNSDAKDERKLHIGLRLRESLVGRLHRLVNEGIALGKYPWKTLSECVTVLITDGLRSRKGDDTIDDMLPHLEYQSHIDRIHQIRREAQGGLNKAREEISELLGIGATDQAIQYYSVTMDAAHKMPPTAWRDWMIKSLEKSFPDLAKQKPRGVHLIGRKKR